MKEQKQFKINSLKDNIDLPTPKFCQLTDQIYGLTHFICTDYPQHKNWFYNKQLPETINSTERDILYATDIKDHNTIAGVLFLKKTPEEAKICTMLVDSKYRGMGLGSQMLETAFQKLGTSQPLITFADYKFPMFANMIKKYNWELQDIVTGQYNDHAKELCFNGTLTKQPTLNHHQLEQALQNYFAQTTAPKKTQFAINPAPTQLKGIVISQDKFEINKL